MAQPTVTKEGPRFVMDARTKRCYPEDQFVVAFNESFLGHLASVSRPSTTARSMARTITSLKHERHHKAVISGAMEILRRTPGEDVSEVARIGGSVVATFAD